MYYCIPHTLTSGLPLPLLGLHDILSAPSVKSHPEQRRGREGAYEKLETPGIMHDYSLAAVAVCFLFSLLGYPKRHVASFRLA